jgi:hypothetical protein
MNTPIMVRRAAIIPSALLAALVPALAAPNITDVVETGGDNEATDTITAKWTGQTWNATVAGEPAVGLAIGDPYTAPVFGDKVAMFVDRAHQWVNPTDTLAIPFYLVGQEYILSGNDNRDNATYKLDITLAFESTVYLLIDDRLSDGDNLTPPTFGPTSMQWVLDEGWTPVVNGINRFADPARPDHVGIDESANGTIDQWASVYAKDFPAGTISLLQADNAGRNMYGVVVAQVPEPSTLALLGLGGLGLLLRRRGQGA